MKPKRIEKRTSAYWKDWRAKNRLKVRATWKRWEAKNKDYVKDKKLQWRYGITLSEFLAMHEKQGNVCKICLGIRGVRKLVVDHQHETGKVRGLLCENCNRGIGLFDDNIEILKSAIKYLEETGQLTHAVPEEQKHEEISRMNLKYI